MILNVKKEIEIGTINANISNSGIGGSVRVEGYRLGVEPKVDYIHVGKDPVRYKKHKRSDSSKTEGRSESGSNQEEDVKKSNANQADPEDHESVGASSLTETESEEVIEEINSVKSRWNFWPFAALLTICSIAISPVVAGVGALLTTFVYQRDKIRKTVALLYDFEGETERQYKQVCDSFEFAANADEVLFGAAEFATPGCVRTNIPIPSISTDDRSLYFFPDLLLVESDGRVSKFSYEEGVKIRTSMKTNKSANHPSDARLKDTEWEHSNKDGSRDKRYSDNKKLFLTLYERIVLKIKEKGYDRFKIAPSKANSSNKVKNILRKLPLDNSYGGENIEEEIEEDYVRLFRKLGNEKQKKVSKRVLERDKSLGKNLEQIRKDQNKGVTDNDKKEENDRIEKKDEISDKYDLEEVKTIEDTVELLRKMDDAERKKISKNVENKSVVEEIIKMIKEGFENKKIVKKIKDTNKEEKSHSGSPSVPYEEASLSVQPQESLHEMATRRPAEWVKKVVLEESPIHKEVAARRVADSVGVSRMGNRIQNALEDAIQHAIQKGWIREKNRLLFNPGQEDIPVRDRSDIEGKARDIEYVPGPEISKAVKQVVESSSSIGEDELIQKVAQRLGFARAGSKIQERVGSIIGNMVEEETLDSEDGHLVAHK